MHSTDRGSSWVREDWAWRDIGYPTWINAGRNYEDAEDPSIAYFVSPDGPSAYVDYPALILGRVASNRAHEQEAYEFLAGLDAEGSPLWGGSCDRHPVFEDERGCFRPEAVFFAPLSRYFLFLMSPREDWNWWFAENKTRRGRIAVYEAEKPWGPWREVFLDTTWCTDEDRFQPRVPVKWLDADGMGFDLVYSCVPRGPYCFNVQHCRLCKRGA